MHLQDKEDVVRCLSQASTEISRVDEHGSEASSPSNMDTGHNNTAENFPSHHLTGAIEKRDLTTFHVSTHISSRMATTNNRAR